MKKFIIFMFISLFLSGCFQSVKKITPKSSVSNVSFEHVDINRDGNITNLIQKGFGNYALKPHQHTIRFFLQLH